MKKLLICLIIIFNSLLNPLIMAQNPTLSFDGIDDYINLGSDVGNGARTIELWFKLEQSIDPFLNDFSTLVAREISFAVNYNEFALSFQPYHVAYPGHLRFDIDGTQPYKSVYSDNDTWNANQWYHVAAVIHPDEGMMFFIDGIKQSITHSHNIEIASASSISTIGCWGNSYIRNFKGSIDDVRFSSEALYTENFTPPCPDLIATPSTLGLWNFNENSGNIVYDSSENGYDGQISGAFWSTDTICMNALFFDGIDDYVNLGSEAGNGLRSVELWFKPEQEINPQLNDFKTLVAREIDTSNNMNEFSLAFQPYDTEYPGHLRFDIDNTAPFKSVYSDNSIWNADQWYHVAAVIHPVEGMMLFIDGEKQLITHDHSQETGNSSGISTIGCWGNSLSRYFEGSIDDVRFSANVPYSTNFTPPCPDLFATTATMGLWNFNQKSGTIAQDSGPNAYHGQINGATGILTNVCEDSTFTKISYLNSGLKNGINVFPNPSSAIFNFEFHNTKSLQLNINVYNSFGQIVFTQYTKDRLVKINFQNQPNGMYYFHISNGIGIIYSGKLIKN